MQTPGAGSVWGGGSVALGASPLTATRNMTPRFAHMTASSHHAQLPQQQQAGVYHYAPATPPPSALRPAAPLALSIATPDASGLGHGGYSFGSPLQSFLRSPLQADAAHGGSGGGEGGQQGIVAPAASAAATASDAWGDETSGSGGHGAADGDSTAAVSPDGLVPKHQRPTAYAPSLVHSSIGGLNLTHASRARFGRRSQAASAATLGGAAPSGAPFVASSVGELPSPASASVLSKSLSESSEQELGPPAAADRAVTAPARESHQLPALAPPQSGGHAACLCLPQPAGSAFRVHRVTSAPAAAAAAAPPTHD